MILRCFRIVFQIIRCVLWRNWSLVLSSAQFNWFKFTCANKKCSISAMLVVGLCVFALFLVCSEDHPTEEITGWENSEGAIYMYIYLQHATAAPSVQHSTFMDFFCYFFLPSDACFRRSAWQRSKSTKCLKVSLPRIVSLPRRLRSLFKMAVAVQRWWSSCWTSPSSRNCQWMD